MKRKMILSLVMAAAVTLGASGMATNANFTAEATSSGNIFTMGTVQLQRGSEAAAQKIAMNQLFFASNMGFDKVSTTTTSINIRGSLPVVLSANFSGLVLPAGESLDTTGFSGVLTSYFNTSVTPNLNWDANGGSAWWRQYKMSVIAYVMRDGKMISYSESRPSTTQDGYDSFFDTINGTEHNGITDTKGISQVLADLGTVKPGDVVTITTKMKLISDLFDGHGAKISDGKLTNEQQNIFQGKSIGGKVTITATEVQ